LRTHSDSQLAMWRDQQLDAHPEDVPAPPIFRAERSYLFSTDAAEGPRSDTKQLITWRASPAGHAPANFQTICPHWRQTLQRASEFAPGIGAFVRGHPRRSLRSENFTLERVLQFERRQNCTFAARDDVSTRWYGPPSQLRPFSTRTIATPFIGGSSASARLSNPRRADWLRIICDDLSHAEIQCGDRSCN